jgi:hypothetical protein
MSRGDGHTLMVGKECGKGMKRGKEKTKKVKGNIKRKRHKEKTRKTRKTRS